MQRHSTATHLGGVGTYRDMNVEQIKRLYRLITGTGIIVFLIFGYQGVHERWDDSLGSSLRYRLFFAQQDHKILTDREHDRILVEKGQEAAKEYRQSYHPDTRLHRAWQFSNAFENWGWALTLASMLAVSWILYWTVWNVASRCFRYVRGDNDPQT